MMPEIITPSFFFLIGLCLGSFLSVLVFRGSRLFDWVGGVSQCGECSHKLTVIDLVPVFSFGLTRGKCRYCGTRISKIYPLLELVSGLLALTIYFLLGVGILSVLLLAAMPFLLSCFIRLISGKGFMADQLVIGTFFLGTAALFS